MKFLLMLSLVCLTAASAGAGIWPGRFHVRVVDEDGYAVTNAIIKCGFYEDKDQGYGAGSKVRELVTVTTKVDGLCLVEGKGNGSVGWRVEKEGYYDTIGPSDIFSGVAEGRLQPWESIHEVVLRKIVDPIPMYARRFGVGWPPAELPEIGEYVGFDLIQSDWIEPYGKGCVQHMMIKLDVERVTKPSPYDDLYPAGRVPTRHNVTLTVVFPGEESGIQTVYAQPRPGSSFRLPRYAPVEGYSTQLVSRLWQDPDNPVDNTDRDDINYIFRIRAETNLLYGKINGDINYNADGTIGFTYCFNPNPNDRNLEFDPQQNLFTNLPTYQLPYEP